MQYTLLLQKISLLKKVLAILFLFSYIVAMLRPIAPIIEYAINQDYIAEFLCINKDKPELKCNGKCHLKKEIKKAQEETHKSLSINIEDYPISPVYNFNSSLNKTFTSSTYKSVFYSYTKKYIYLYISDIFHPPQV